jgi:hypothetical protein
MKETVVEEKIFRSLGDDEDIFVAIVGYCRKVRNIGVEIFEHKNNIIVNEKGYYFYEN